MTITTKQILEEQKKGWVRIDREIDDWQKRFLNPLILRYREYMQGRVSLSGWPLRDSAAPEEDC